MSDAPPGRRVTRSDVIHLGAVDIVERFRFDPPAPDGEMVRRIAHDLYGVTGRCRRLRGERSHNTLFVTDEGHRVVLKVQSPTEDVSTIEMHAAALEFLAARDPRLPIARLVRTRDGTAVPLVDIDGRRHPTRLVTFLPGVTYPDGGFVSDTGMRSIGELIGAVAKALTEFDHPAADHFMAWDIANGLALDRQLHDLVDGRSRRLLQSADERLLAAASAMERLPRQIVHNDGHGGNLLHPDGGDDRATGLIDFGDMVRTIRAADLAVAGANLAPNQPDPARALALLASGYLARHELTDDEIDALPDLVVTRLVLSIVLSTLQVHHTPHIAEAVAAELPGTIEGLERWLALNPRAVRARIREELEVR